MEQRRKRMDFLTDAVYIAVVCGLVLLAYKYLLDWLMPLIAGYFIAWTAHPLVKRISRGNPHRKKLAGCLVPLAGYGVLLAGLVAVGAALIEWLQTLILQLPGFYRDTLLPAARTLDQLADRLMARVYPSYSGSDLLQAAVLELRDQLLSLLGGAVSGLGAIGAGLSGFLVTCVFSVVCSVLISMGYEEFTAFFARQFPKSWHSAIQSVRKSAGIAVSALVQRTFLLMLVTFLQLAAGLWLLGMSHWLAAAAAISLLDALPFLGTGCVLIPWALAALLGGNPPLAAGLCILWAISAFVRNILDLKMTGAQPGLHPLAAICAAYLGFKVMGGWGMIVFPIAAALAAELHSAGHIKLWK